MLANNVLKSQKISAATIVHSRLLSQARDFSTPIGRINPIKQSPTSHPLPKPTSHAGNLAREFGYFTVVLVGICAVGAAFYEVFNLATHTPDLVFEQASSLVKRDSRVQEMLGVPLDTSTRSMTKQKIKDGVQYSFVVAGVYAGKAIATAYNDKQSDGSRKVMKLALVEVYAGGKRIIVYDGRPNRKSWFRWNSPLGY
jgi:hypothetical protein